MISYKEEREAKFEEFIIKSFQVINKRQGKKTLISYLEAPHHIFTKVYERGLRYNFQEPIKKVSIRYNQDFFDGEKVISLKDKIIKEIVIPKPTPES